jgi:hypothetical protein
MQAGEFAISRCSSVENFFNRRGRWQSLTAIPQVVGTVCESIHGHLVDACVHLLTVACSGNGRGHQLRCAAVQKVEKVGHSTHTVSSRASFSCNVTIGRASTNARVKYDDEKVQRPIHSSNHRHVNQHHSRRKVSNRDAMHRVGTTNQACSQSL